MAETKFILRTQMVLGTRVHWLMQSFMKFLHALRLRIWDCSNSSATEKAISAMEEYKEVLSIWFRNIRPWEETEVCETRRLWIEILGIPGQAWSWENVKKIANCWGELVCTDTPTEKVSSFSMARALIDTTSMSPIEGQVLLYHQRFGFQDICP